MDQPPRKMPRFYKTQLWERDAFLPPPGNADVSQFESEPEPHQNCQSEFDGGQLGVSHVSESVTEAGSVYNSDPTDCETVDANRDECDTSECESDTSSGSDSDHQTITDDLDTDSDSDTSNDESAIHLPRQSVPLYAGATITNIEASVLLLNLYLKFKLTKSVLSMFLLFLQFILPSGNTFPRTVHMLFKLILDNSTEVPIEKLSYCGKCKRFITIKKDRGSCVCGEDTQQECSFFYISVEHTLKSYFERENLFKYINKKRQSGSLLQDISDGQNFQDLTLNQFDVTLFWNTDGVRVYKSGSQQLWPLHCTVTGVPFHLRKVYSFVPTIWYGAKPIFSLYFRPFISELKRLSAEGFKWIHPITGDTVISRVFAPVCSVDAVAKAPLQGLNQFNGAYGCNTCEVQGETYTKPGTTSRRRIYRPQEKADLRTVDRMVEQASLAESTGRPNTGVQFLSVLFELPEFCIAQSFCIDYMHAVILGVVRMFVFAWFDSSNHNEAFYMNRFIDKVDQRLTSIRTPDYITRNVRSLSHRARFKASELRNFLIFYSLPCLRGIMPTVYLAHWTLFVSALSILLKSEVDLTEVIVAEKMLQQFVEETGKLYGAEFFTYNLHNLLHLGLSVRRWGPLWSNSAFQFEDRNGNLTRQVRGYQMPDKQLVNLINLDGRCKELGNASGSPMFWELSKKIQDDGTKRKPSSSEIVLHKKKSDSKFLSITQNNMTISAKSSKVKANCFISYSSNGKVDFAKVNYFFKDDNGNAVMNIEPYKKDKFRLFKITEPVKFTLKSMFPCFPTGLAKDIIISDHVRITKCVKVLDYFCEPPNVYEINL